LYSTQPFNAERQSREAVNTNFLSLLVWLDGESNLGFTNYESNILTTRFATGTKKFTVFLSLTYKVIAELKRRP